MVITNFNGVGVGFGFGVGCGFGVGWGFGGMPLNFLGLGAGSCYNLVANVDPSGSGYSYYMTLIQSSYVTWFLSCGICTWIVRSIFQEQYYYWIGGGCGVGVGLGWGFGTAYGSKYRSSRITFQGMEFDNKVEKGNPNELSKASTEIKSSG
ncbi:hypothetical protein Ahy_A07g033105 isoform C [Arachis hypogaea]|uniref:Uncharacterized protein n=1 Tax=Arachis hypogaea TaxID=3818 RepID=A0A445C8A1_ARAHY|nr:hypothetical protein Ahy_A07g033105 isoform C [Arachis hypogaea]